MIQKIKITFCIFIFFCCTKKERESYILPKVHSSKSSPAYTYHGYLELWNQLNKDLVASKDALQKRLDNAVFLHKSYNIAGGIANGIGKFGVQSFMKWLAPNQKEPLYSLRRNESEINEFVRNSIMEPVKGAMGDASVIQELSSISEEAQSTKARFQKEKEALIAKLQETAEPLSVSDRQGLKDAQQVFLNEIGELEKIAEKAKEEKDKGSSKTAEDNTKSFLQGYELLRSLYALKF